MSKDKPPVPEVEYNPTIRILRVLEYVGPLLDVQRTLEGNAVKGLRMFGPVMIQDAIVGSRPDLAPPGYLENPQESEA